MDNSETAVKLMREKINQAGDECGLTTFDFKEPRGWSRVFWDLRSLLAICTVFVFRPSPGRVQKVEFREGVNGEVFYTENDPTFIDNRVSKSARSRQAVRGKKK